MFLRAPLGALHPKGKPICVLIIITGQHQNASHSLSDTKDHLHRIACSMDLHFKFKMVIEKFIIQSFVWKEHFSQKQWPNLIHKIDS